MPGPARANQTPDARLPDASARLTAPVPFRRTTGPAGLHNFGTTCYFNAVLQALYFLPEFREAVARWDFSELRRPPKPKTTLPSSTTANADLAGEQDTAPLARALKSLFMQMSDAKPGATVMPTDFWRTLQNLGDDFPTFGQQDAQEFLRFLLDRLRSELRFCDDPEAEQPEPADATAGRGGKRKRTAAVPGPGAQEDSSSVTALFQGRVVTKTRCLECGSVSSREETFLDLSLPASPSADDSAAVSEHPQDPSSPKSSSSEERVQEGRIGLNTPASRPLHYSLTWALGQQAKTETMRGRDKYHCEDVCNHLTEAQRMWKLRHVPPIVTLHLMMFSYERGKIPSAVAIPMTLRFSQWMEDGDRGGAGSDPGKLYMLDAVVVHEGLAATSGHYFAYARETRSSDDSRWWWFDDESVRLVRERDLRRRLMPVGRTPNRTAYLLFYRACEGEG